MGIPQSVIKENQEHLQNLWQELGGLYDNPYSRTKYTDLGYEDDAQLFTEEILKNLMDYMDSTDEIEVFDAVLREEFFLEDIIKDKAEYFNQHWIVVIDYHT